MFLVHSMLVDLKTKLVSPSVTMYFFCSLSKWWNLCSRVVKKLIYLWSVWYGLITISLCNWMTVESWNKRILLSHWAHFWANPSWLIQVLRTWSIQICEYLELDFAPPIFGPLKIRSNGLSIQGWAGLWLFFCKCKLSLCITLISKTELIARYLTRFGLFVFLNVI